MHRNVYLTRQLHNLKSFGPKGFPKYTTAKLVRGPFKGKQFNNIAYGGSIGSIFKGLFGGLKNLLGGLFNSAKPMLKQGAKTLLNKGLDVAQKELLPKALNSVTKKMNLSPDQKKTLSDYTTKVSSVGRTALDSKAQSILDKVLGQGMNLRNYKKPKKSKKSGSAGLVPFGMSGNFGSGLNQF